MDCIEQILKVRGDGGSFCFRVTLSDGRTTATVDIGAAALQSYSTFQREVLEAAGIYFRHEAYELPRCGLRHWRDDVERLMDGAKEVVRA